MSGKGELPQWTNFGDKWWYIFWYIWVWLIPWESETNQGIVQYVHEKSFPDVSVRNGWTICPMLFQSFSCIGGRPLSIGPPDFSFFINRLVCLKLRYPNIFKVYHLSVSIVFVFCCVLRFFMTQPTSKIVGYFPQYPYVVGWTTRTTMLRHTFCLHLSAESDCTCQISILDGESMLNMVNSNCSMAKSCSTCPRPICDS